MAEATNRLYRDLLKREKPAVVQVEVFNDPGCGIEGASLHDSDDGLIVILDEDRGDAYIPEWHILDGKLYPVVEVRLGNLQNLSSLYIPKTVTSIDMKCISVGSSLSSIQVAENHPRYDNRNSCNAIIETATNKLVLGCKVTEIPFSVTSIGNYAFRNIPQKELSYPAEVMFFPE
jgi:hypothetical protein